MTIFILLSGLYFADEFQSLEILILITADVLFRAYGFFCVMSLVTIFRNEEHEHDLINATNRERMSYGGSESGVSFKRNSQVDPFMNRYE
jgi:hypothetical protein